MQYLSFIVKVSDAVANSIEYVDIEYRQGIIEPCTWQVMAGLVGTDGAALSANAALSGNAALSANAAPSSRLDAR